MRKIVIDAQNNAIRGVEFTRMMMYWHLGERIFTVASHLKQNSQAKISGLSEGFCAF